MNLATAIVRQSAPPPPAGLGAPPAAFEATVLATSPLRVQAFGVDVPATAIVGLTLTIGQVVIVLSIGSTHRVIGRIT